MRLSNDRNRTNQTREETEAPGASEAAAAGGLTARARDLLEAGDDVIEQALSENPALFLASSRQLGGQ